MSIHKSYAETLSLSGVMQRDETYWRSFLRWAQPAGYWVAELVCKTAVGCDGNTPEVGYAADKDGIDSCREASSGEGGAKGISDPGALKPHRCSAEDPGDESRDSSNVIVAYIGVRLKRGVVHVSEYGATKEFADR